MKTSLSQYLLWAFLAPLAALHAQPNYATPYTFTTLAGRNGNGSTDGTGGAARFYNPVGLTMDASGNIYVADATNQTIRKITSAGVVTTLAGAVGQQGYSDSTDGTGATARFAGPQSLAVDSAGNVFVADYGNNAIRKITPAGVVTTFAGMGGTFGYGHADGTGSAARFHGPCGLAVDSADNLYVSDNTNSLIRKITPGAVVTTLAGTLVTSGFADGPGAAAEFNNPLGLTVDSAGNVYVADAGNFCVRKITPDGTVSTLAGNSLFSGWQDGTGFSARFSSPAAVSVDTTGDVFVADAGNFTIREITPDGTTTTIAGLSTVGGSADGTGSAARFLAPQGISVDGAGNVYVADTANSTIRKIGLGTVTTIAGRATTGADDGPGVTARFSQPTDLAIDGSDNVYIADPANNTIRMITPGGIVSTLAGSAAAAAGSVDGTGAAARFNYPSALAVDTAGTVYVADSQNYTIRKITSGGVVTTLAGSPGNLGTTDGTGSAARFNFCRGIALDGAGNLYVSDSTNSTIRKVTPGGVVTTLAGLAGTSGFADGTGSAARFSSPYGLVVDPAGNVFVADSGNQRIRRITPAGVVTTIAGSSVGQSDGSVSAPNFVRPRGVVLDPSGNLYVSDFAANTLRKVTPAGVVTTLAGSSTASLDQVDGTGSAVHFQNPRGLAFDSAGLLYIADVTNGAIRRGSLRVDADFNGDRQSDIGWQNTTTGDRGTWLMNGTTFAAWQSFGSVSTALRMVGKGDFNGDGKTDIVWENTATGKRVIWFMNGTAFTSSFNLGIVSPDWHIAAVADFTGSGAYNCDGKPDLLWQNTVTGDCGFWQMDGTAYVAWIDVGVVDLSWHIVGAADFNGDGHPDIVWENAVTGDRGVWLMNGTNFQSWVDIGIVSTDWHIAAVADYNGDGLADIVFENTVTSDRYIWLMNGTSYSSGVDLGVVSTDWHIAN